jgi:hypothetical protein
VLSDWTLDRVVGLAPRTRALWGDFIRAATAMLGLLLVAGHAVIYAQMLSTTMQVRVFEDYGIFDESARRVVDGAGLYDPGAMPPGRNGKPRAPNLNPPHFHLLLLPLTVVSQMTGFAVWMLASGLAFLAALAIMARTARLTIWGTALLATAAFTAPAMIATVITGQVGLLILLPFTLAWYRLREGRDGEAGVWLGVCAGTKLFVLLHLAFLVHARRWRAAATMAVTLATLFALGLAVFGVGAYRHWLAQLGSVTWAEHYMNGSLLGLIERTLSTSDWQYVPLIEWPWLVRPLWIGAAALVVWRGVGALRQPLAADRQFLIVTAAMLLLSPLGWVYYLFLLMPPLAAVLASDQPILDARTRRILIAGGAALLVPAPIPWLSLQWDSGIVTATLGGIYTWGLLIVFLAATRVSTSHEVSHSRS